MLILPSVWIWTAGTIPGLVATWFTALSRSWCRTWRADTLLTNCRLTLYVVLTTWLTYLWSWIIIFSWGRILNPRLNICVPGLIIRGTLLCLAWPCLIVSVLIPVKRWILLPVHGCCIRPRIGIPAIYICTRIDGWIVCPWSVLDILVSVPGIVKCPDRSAARLTALIGRTGLHVTTIPVEFKITFIPCIDVTVTEWTIRLSYSQIIPANGIPDSKCIAVSDAVGIIIPLVVINVTVNIRIIQV